MVNSWRLLNTEYRDPRKEIALDEAVLIAVDKGTAPNTIRLWRTPNTVILGCFQSVESEVNQKACRRYGTSILRRFTGGGAVYQDQGNLNWSFIIDRNDVVIRNIKNVLEVYRIFSIPIMEGLRILGVDSEFCSPNSILVKNRKLSGMAAYFKRKAVLCHGTLLLSSNLAILSKVLKNLKADVTTLESELGRKISIEDAIDALISGFEITFNMNAVPGKLSAVERNLLKDLHDRKYSRIEWNLHRFF